MWLEQLLAESTGKEGKGLLPVAGEPVGEPEVYRNDRVFIYIRMKDTTDKNLETSVSLLREAGQPVITIFLDDLLDLGQEFFRWEIATATAGSILGINAFNQPNVQESKDNTNRLAGDGRRRKANCPKKNHRWSNDPLKLYFEEKAATVPATLETVSGPGPSGAIILALMAYIAENPVNQRALQDIRVMLQERMHLITTLGYGPRFLHSTGQFHKGGPNTGLFIQLTADDAWRCPDPWRTLYFWHLQARPGAGRFGGVAETWTAGRAYRSWTGYYPGVGSLEKSPGVCF